MCFPFQTVQRSNSKEKCTFLEEKKGGNSEYTLYCTMKWENYKLYFEQNKQKNMQTISKQNKLTGIN